ncbi:MAG: hypothetical protein IKW43_04485 [Bacteroidaceae bacterium]|nr:hypothetical protein [Bacteroidaceae bacterium]
MKKWFLHILLLAGLFGMLTTSCSQEEDLEPQIQPSKEKVHVSFSIALDTPSARSRAIWGDNYDNDNTNDYPSEIGNDFENSINPEQFYVQIVLNGVTSDVLNVVYWKTEAVNVYQFVGEVDVDINATTTFTNAKVMVSANIGKKSNGTIETSFGTQYSGNLVGRGVEYIPMWGVTKIPSLSLVPGSQVDLGPIYLLRAMAKIEVTLDQAKVAEGYSIHGAQLQSYNDTGNLRPNDYADLDNTLEFETFSCFNQFVGENNLPSTVAQTGGLAFVQSGDNRYIIYVPECEYNDEQILVQVKKGNNDILTQNKTFPGFPMNITNLVRNHLYSYKITQINDGASLKLDCQVQPWDDDEEIWDYREQVSVETDGQLQWAEGIAKEGTTVYIPYATRENPATCEFRLSTPAGGTWYASFENQTGVYNAFKFLKTTIVDGNTVTEEVTSVSGKVGEQATLRIITTNTAASVTSSAVLRIAVRTSDGRTIIVKELVPNQTNAEYTLVQSKQ